MSSVPAGIANIFIGRALQDGKDLTPMQIQKLVYIAHGWNLAVNQKPLTDVEPEAWDYGPVYVELYEALKRYGSGSVTDKIKYDDFSRGTVWDDPSADVEANVTPEEQALVDSVYELYSNFHAFQLSAMTHEKDTPWHKIYVEQEMKSGKISNETIKDHFIDIARQRQAAE